MAHYEDQAQREYQEFMDRIEPEVTITIGPDANGTKAIAQEYFELTGTDNPYEHRELHEELYRKHRISLTLRGVSLNEAQAFAEPLRIAHPDQCVSLSTPDGSWIGNTTWNDQMEMFFGYPVYTPYGEKLKRERNEYAEAEGIPMAWE